MNAGCAGKTEIPRERVPYLSALEVCSRQGVIQIHVYLYLLLYMGDEHIVFKVMGSEVKLTGTFASGDIQFIASSSITLLFCKRCLENEL